MSGWSSALLADYSKTAWQILSNLDARSTIRKLLKGKVLFRTLPTIPFQIVCKLISNSKFIIKSIVDPDDIRELLTHLHLESAHGLTTLKHSSWNKVSYESIWGGIVHPSRENNFQSNDSQNIAFLLQWNLGMWTPPIVNTFPRSQYFSNTF